MMRNHSDQLQMSAASPGGEPAWRFWGSAALVAGVIAFAAHALAAVFPLADDIALFLLLLPFLRMSLAWNLHKEACRTGEKQGAAWREIADGKERIIRGLSEMLSEVNARVKCLEAWLRLIPEADRISEEEIIAEAERAAAELRAKLLKRPSSNGKEV